ncbi:MAG: SPOR domain-containing protein [Rhodothermales bacterium]|nr:SPOR domain-containing protein [Rhodothermales bacterium]
MKQHFLTALMPIACLVLLSACSGSGNTVQGPADDNTDQAAVDLRGTETFDSRVYEIEPPSLSGEIVHDVPDELMAGDEGDNRSMRIESGFRIQIHSTLVKDEAVEKETQANLWWDTLPPEERLEGLGLADLAIYLHFQSPYYRVRVGNFSRRSEAETALALVQEVFPSAFIAVDTVRVFR